MKITILGCGTSSGVPRIGDDWGECDPAEPKNRRRRVSILIESDTTRILVDTSPDMREQLLDAGVSRLDAVIWTHDHADHCHGLDDLRQVFHTQGRPARGFARPATVDVLTSRFGYVFAGAHGYPAVASLEALPDCLAIGDIEVQVVDQPHGAITSAGLRFSSGARSAGYATDFNNFTNDMHILYEQLDLWVVDALRKRPHPTHPHLDMTLGLIEQQRPKRAVLVHMDNSMDYATLRAELPAGVEPGYDGMEIAL